MPTPSPSIVVESVQPLTTDSQAIVELGKKLFVDSLDTTRDTCKLLVTLGASAIPVYVALLRVVIGERSQPTAPEVALQFAPGVFFLASTIAAVDGLRPLKGRIVLNVIEDIVNYRDTLLSRRASAANWAFWLFAVGVGATLVAGLVFLQR